MRVRHVCVQGLIQGEGLARFVAVHGLGRRGARGRAAAGPGGRARARTINRTSSWRACLLSAVPRLLVPRVASSRESPGIPTSELKRRLRFLPTGRKRGWHLIADELCMLPVCYQVPRVNAVMYGTGIRTCKVIHFPYCADPVTLRHFYRPGATGQLLGGLVCRQHREGFFGWASSCSAPGCGRRGASRRAGRPTFSMAQFEPANLKRGAHPITSAEIQSQLCCA